MNKSQFLMCLNELEVTQVEAATLLSVTPRSVSRWLEREGENIPGPVEQALNAWLRLKRRGLAWRPDQIPFDENWPGFSDQIKRLREHAIITDQILSKVESRGGPATRWKIDLNKQEAIFGPLRLSFDMHPNGSFSPSIYSRSDQNPDVVRDQLLLEDAFYCIAKEIKK